VHGLYLTQLRGSKTTNAAFGMVRALSRPAVRPYENTALRRVGATYEIFFHPVS
ncbi:phage tail termination protein, partial [Streptomyces tendae]